MSNNSDKLRIRYLQHHQLSKWNLLRLKPLNNYLILNSKSEDVNTPDALMINDLFNCKHEESKLSYNIYHDYSVRNLNANNTKNKRNDFINFRRAIS